MKLDFLGNVMTDGERLAKIEAILERVEERVDALCEAHAKDVADLQHLKSKGSGILIGVALAAAAGGASLWNMILAWID